MMTKEDDLGDGGFLQCSWLELWFLKVMLVAIHSQSPSTDLVVTSLYGYLGILRRRMLFHLHKCLKIKGYGKTYRTDTGA